MNRRILMLLVTLVISTANADEIIIEAEAEVMEFEESRICLDCRCLPLAKTEPLEPCVEAKPEVVYKDRIIYEKEIVFKERQAPKKNHISLGVTHSESKVEEMDTVSKIGATIGVGYEFSPYIGAELRAGKTDGRDIQQLSVFVKPMLPIGTKLNLYGLIGYGESQITNGEFRTEIRSPLVGAGIEVDNLFVDFTRQHVKRATLHTISAGVIYDF